MVRRIISMYSKGGAAAPPQINGSAFGGCSKVSNSIYPSFLTAGPRGIEVKLRHAIPAFIILLDLMLNGIPVRLFHAVYAALWTFIYVLFTCFYYFYANSGPLYPVQDWSKPSRAVIWSAVAILLPFIIQVGIALLLLTYSPSHPLPRRSRYRRCVDGWELFVDKPRNFDWQSSVRLPASCLSISRSLIRC